MKSVVYLQYSNDEYTEMEYISSRNIGQAFVWGVMGKEAIQAIQDLRWMIVLCFLLIIADFRFGMAESKKKYTEAVAQNNEALAKVWEFRFSKAVRRTCNKFVDYMTFLLIFCIMGFAFTEPYGICNHVITAGVAVIIACICELASIFGHFFAIKGIPAPKITWKSTLVFLGKIIANFAKTKDSDLGDAIDNTISETLQDNKKKGKKK